MKGRSKAALSLILFVSFAILATAQTQPNLETGYKPYGSHDVTSIDSINTMNGDLQVHIGLPFNYPQRGDRISLPVYLQANSKGWHANSYSYPCAGSCSALGWGNPPGGIQLITSPTMAINRVWQSDAAYTGGAISYDHFGYNIVTRDGASHTLSGDPATVDSTGEPWSFDASDTSGLHLQLSGPGTGGVPSSATVTDRNGNQYQFGPWGGRCRTNANAGAEGAMPPTHGGFNNYGQDTIITCNQRAVAQSVTDSNGNVISFGNSDMLGRSTYSVTSTTDYSGCVGTVSSATIYGFPAYNGGSAQLKLCSNPPNLATAFNVPNVAEYPTWPGATNYDSPWPGRSWVTTAVLPDGSKYTFSYDSYGEITSIGLPTGGSISYTWTTIALNPCNDFTSASRAVASRLLNDGLGHTQTWSYAYSAPSLNSLTTVVTDPNQNDTVHIFTGVDNNGCMMYETSTRFYSGSSGSGQLLKQVDTHYLSTLVRDESGYPAGMVGNVVPDSIKTTVYPSNKMTQITKSYDPPQSTTGVIFGNVVTEKAYDWGPSAPGALLRETDTNYQWQANSSYLTARLLDLPSSVIVKDGIANRAAETDYSYDEPNYLTTPAPAITTQHAAPPYGVRGNLSTTSRWLNTSNNFIPSHTNWYDTGEVYQQTDPLGHTSTHSYDPFYAGAYVTQTCSPQTGTVAHCVSATYDFNTGLLTSFTNENATTQASGNTPGDAAHTSNYTYDTMWRLTSGQAPPDPANSGARAQSTFTFSPGNTFPFSVQRTKSVTTSLSDATASLFDGLGRGYKGQHTLPNGTATVDTTFDLAGHIATISNPYFTTSDSTYGLTTNQYDALDRAIQTTRQDGSISSTSYDVVASGALGDCTVSIDEAGKTRRGCSDALGRLVEVDEPNAAAVGVNATASTVITGAVNSAAGPNGPALPPISTAPLSSVVTPDNLPHVFFAGTDQHVYHFWWTSASGWQNQDLTQATGAALASSGGGLSAFVNSGGCFHASYIATNQHVIDLFMANVTGGCATAWSSNDMTATTGAPLAAAASSVSYIGAGGDGLAHIFFIASNSHVYRIYYPNAGGTLAQDLTAASGGALAGNSAGIAGIINAGGCPHLSYIDANQHLSDLFMGNVTGGCSSSWSANDMTALTGNTSLALAGSPIVSMKAAGDGLAHLFYIGSNQHVYRVYWPNSGGVQNQDLSALAGNLSISSGSGLEGIVNSGGCPHVRYVASNQHINDLYLSNVSGGCSNTWNNSDLTSISGNTSAATASKLTSVGVAGDGLQHIFYVSSASHLDRLYWNTSGVFQNQDLTTYIAGTVYYDAGTVSLSVGAFTAAACFGSSTNSACSGKPVNQSSADVAAALAQALNASGSPVSAIASGSSINMTWLQAGPFTPAVSALATVHDNSTLFPNPSFNSAATSFSGGQAAGFDANSYVTLYQYDALGNLIRVDQKGSAPSDSTQWRTRTFTYDSLSRLLTATNPESGTITYSYDNDGNLLHKTSPAPNQTGTVIQTISYCYDELNRVTGKGYGAQNCPLATPVVTYAYDSGANAKGKLTSLADQAGTATYTYDILGRLSTETRTLIGANNASIPKTVSYDYNLDGSVYKLHYPSGAVVTYTPDSAGRTLSAIDSGGSINYVTGATYGPDSALTGFISGNSGTFAGITNAFNYNKRLQPLTMSATAPSQTVFSIGYDFHAGNGTAGSGTDNGNVFGISNYKDTTHGRDQTFTYDALNRLISAQNAGTDCTVKILQNKTEYWGNSYSYDAWGNLLQKTITKCGAEHFSVTADAHNWIHATAPDYQYDAAGNMTFDATASLSYTFDQENRLTGAAGYTYTYDSDGNRVRKSNGNLAANGTLYWYMTPGGVAETDLAGTLKSEYIFFDGERVARKDFPTNSVAYYFSDNLKTASVITDAVGNIKAESDYYPWGGELQFVNNDSNDYKFTGKKRDIETGLDYFGARYYSNGLGRWVSADWSARPVPVPYANFGDPQSLNLYGYVRGLPTTKADVDGHGVLDWIKRKWAEYEAANAKAEEEARKRTENWRNSPEYKRFTQEHGYTPEEMVGMGMLAFGGAQAGFAYGPEPTVSAPPAEEEPVTARLPQDAAVNPKAPAALPTNRPVGPSPTQNAAAQADIQAAKASGASDIRVNQQQVNASGQRVGINRPDLQHTDASGTRIYTEYGNSTSTREAAHQQRIQTNDPNGKVNLKKVN